ncbi:MAG: hypothetical protein HOI23_09505 [Deltaproteobacteria bacterium]|jgi:hypothetical protein|nr:hypothetical protein [Deltaproteobacteria bacterium]MBT6434226.1 hypothetical protein [Deltaproteobacteria bacterium]MBT6488395.1 hypothetical protein [Deltaproteobacteria bacterium]
MRLRLMVLLWLSLLCAPAFGQQAQTEMVEASEEEPAILEKPGYFGLGLGIQLPMVGVVTGFGATSNPGAGYNLGFALTWEFFPRYELRLYTGGGQTYAARAALDYREDGEVSAQTRSKDQDAQWLGLDVGIGLSYLFRAPSRQWTPFVGIDGGFSFHGYYYSLSDEQLISKLVQTGDSASLFADGETEGIGSSWHLSSRAGVRLDYLRWFSSSLELVVTVSPIGDNEPITNTKSERDVSAPADMLVLTRLVFSIWLGL